MNKLPSINQNSHYLVQISETVNYGTESKTINSLAEIECKSIIVNEEGIFFKLHINYGDSEKDQWVENSIFFKDKESKYGDPSIKIEIIARL